MKLSRIVEELERQGIEPNYTNVAIFVEFVSQEGLAERLRLDVPSPGVAEPETE